MNKKWSFVFLMSAFAFFAVFRLYYFLTDDFSISHISHPIEGRKEWDFSLNENKRDEVGKILNQKFFYLGKGAQVYAFASEDGKYVIKFFKFKHLKPSLFISMLPSAGPLKSFKFHNLQRKHRKLEGLFRGYKNAYLYDREHSGLIYVHLNPTHDLHFKAQLVDKMGREHSIELDPVVFVIQQKGETLRDILKYQLDHDQLDVAVEKAKRVLDMYVAEYQNGVWDRDHGVSHNIGFLHEKPFHLDVGKLSHEEIPPPLEFYVADLKHVSSKIISWVEKNYPQYSEEFKNKLDTHLTALLEQFSIPASLPLLPPSP